MTMKYVKQIITLIAISISTLTLAQNGEDLFKSKCNVCHMLGKDGTGPDLKNVRGKWAEAEEADFIYEWVKDPDALITSGKSKRAEVANEFSPAAMTPQDITNEEIDAIFDFIDSYITPTIEDKSTKVVSEKIVKYVPNYKENLMLFYFLLFTLGVILLAILLIASSMGSFVKMEMNQKIKESKGKITKTILLAIGSFGAITASNVSNALSVVPQGESDPSIPWLLVEDSDIYLMVFLNIALLFVLFYFKKIFTDLFKTIHPPKPKKTKISKRRQRKLTINDVLTGAVDIEKEHTILMEHEYDGIKELDNNLPTWWVWMFYGTIVFAVVYIFIYHIFGTADLQQAEYENSMKKAEIEVNAYLDKMSMNVDESNVTLMLDEKDLVVGKTLYDVNCVACHNPNGEGNIGPNLTDNTWIYNYDIKDVFSTVKNGTNKGMPEHSSKLNPIQLQQVSSFILSMPEAKGKAAEGDIIEE